MKYFLIVFICLLPGVLFGAAPTTSCPAGFTAIKESAMTLQNDSCISGTTQIAMSTQSCLVSAPSGVCLMYVPANTNYNDNSGVYQFSDFCPLDGDGIQKCVKLTSTTECSYAGDVDYFQPDWVANCGGLPIKGLGMCSAEPGASEGAISDKLKISSVDENNSHCWCKMTSPAVSSWFFVASAPGGGRECNHSCAGGCRNSVINEVLFRRAMFTSMGE